MMEFGPAPATRRDIGVVPMINIVFLLLVFFLMTASIAPPEPFETRPPEAVTPDGAAGPARLHVSAAGALAYGAASGPEALAAAIAEAAGQEGEGAVLVVQADAALPAASLARLLGRLAQGGIARVELVTVAP